MLKLVNVKLQVIYFNKKEKKRERGEREGGRIKKKIKYVLKKNIFVVNKVNQSNQSTNFCGINYLLEFTFVKL